MDIKNENIECEYRNINKITHCHIAKCDKRVVHVCDDCERNKKAMAPSHDYYVDLKKGY
jgi:hypothetical protein